MRLAEYIHPELVMVDVEAADAEDLFSQASERLCAHEPCLEKEVLIQNLLQREAKTGTGLEGGVAVPHAMVPGVEKTICQIIRLSKPMDFGALDKKPVKVLFILVSAPEAVAVHIRILARIARFCSTPGFIDRLLEAEADSLYEIVKAEDSRHI
ncbi:MAG: PTS sugar transporter subunit IIA [Deltaproteobacteria bacterium]|nr:PTS sugar transporter subunit IIA [Deltaproteobacteria bacterium]